MDIGTALRKLRPNTTQEITDRYAVGLYYESGFYSAFYLVVYRNGVAGDPTWLPDGSVVGNAPRKMRLSPVGRITAHRIVMREIRARP